MTHDPVLLVDDEALLRRLVAHADRGGLDRAGVISRLAWPTRFQRNASRSSTSPLDRRVFRVKAQA